MPLLPSHGAPIRLRAHSLLCLQGFQGHGHDATFVARMAAVHRTLAADPDTPVEVLAGPDELCGACPHHREGTCTLGGPEHEAHMQSQDEEVLRRLWLHAGDVLPWSRVLELVERCHRATDLASIVTPCPWLPEGWPGREGGAGGGGSQGAPGDAAPGDDAPGTPPATG